VIEYAAPNESSKAHSVNFSNPIEVINPLVDRAIIQNANRKVAGVRISENLILFFICIISMIMVGNYC
jgi:hypothetical protein